MALNADRPPIPSWEEARAEAGLRVTSSVNNKPIPELASDGERIQKVLAAAGVASRRVIEDYIVEGRIMVNGLIVRELGRRINPEVDEVRVNGVPIQLDSTKRYFVLNKPSGVVSTMSDEHGRPDLTRFTKHIEERIYNVGRLDAQTSGLLVLTNDGELAHVLSHPSFGIEKTYIAKVRGVVSAQIIQRLRNGIVLDDGPISADRIRLLPGEGGQYSLVEVTLHSGRNRIVRRMFEAVNHPVVDLVRRSFGPLSLGLLRSGEMRELTKVERGELLTVARAKERQ